MNTFEIALKTKQLPDKIEELVPMMFAGQAAVRFMTAKLKAVSDKNVPDPLGLLEEQRQKTVEDGQSMGEMLLNVMGRIGKLSEKIPQERKVLPYPIVQLTARCQTSQNKGGAPTGKPPKHDKKTVKLLNKFSPDLDQLASASK
jgi:hypothetical protein